MERFDFVTNLSFGSLRFSIDLVFPFPLTFRSSLFLFFGFDRKEAMQPTLLFTVEEFSAPFRTRSSLFDDQLRLGRRF